MKTFFDTSVLIATFWLEHPGHSESLEALNRADQAFCGIHSLAEFYAGMTSLPVRNRYDPQQVVPLIAEVRKRCERILLTEEEYVSTIERSAARGFKSGMIYDALLLRCAEKSGADVIYTWDVKRFRRIAPEMADKIRTP